MWGMGRRMLLLLMRVTVQWRVKTVGIQIADGIGVGLITGPLRRESWSRAAVGKEEGGAGGGGRGGGGGVCVFSSEQSLTRAE